MSYSWGHKELAKNQLGPIWHRFRTVNGRFTLSVSPSQKRVVYSHCGKAFNPDEIVVPGWDEDAPHSWQRHCKECMRLKEEYKA